MKLTTHILNFSYGEIASGWRVKVPSRPYWRLYWNAELGADITSDGTRFPLDPQHMTLVAPHTNFAPHLESPVHQFHIHFQLSKPFDLPKPGIYRIALDDHLKRDLEIAIRTLDQGGTQRLWAMTRLVNNACAGLPELAWNPSICDRRLQSVVDAMEDRQRDPLSNNQLAEVANLSPATFIRLFKQQFNMSPQQYYVEKRLEHASILLEYGEQSIEEIAESCGFCDRNYFSTVFRRKLGVGPAAFRRMARLGSNGAGHRRLENFSLPVDRSSTTEAVDAPLPQAGS